MARPLKNSADWFSHDAYASEDERLMRLESRYGIAGYGVFFKLIELLTVSDDFEIREPDEWWYSMYAHKWHVKEAAMKDIFKAMIELSLIRLENGKIYSKSLKQRMEPLLQKREKDRVNKSTRVFAAKTPVSVAITPIIDTENAQSKVKESKGEKSTDIECSARIDITPDSKESSANGRQSKKQKPIKSVKKISKGKRQSPFVGKEISAMIAAVKLTAAVEEFKEPKSRQRMIGQNFLWLLKGTSERPPIPPDEIKRRLLVICQDDFKRQNRASIGYLYREVKGWVEPDKRIKTGNPKDMVMAEIFRTTKI